MRCRTKALKHIINQFHTNGTLLPKKKERCSSILMPEKLTAICLKMEDRPVTSVHKLASQTAISRATAFHALKKLKLCAYCTRLVQEWLPLDPGLCLAFCNWFIKFVNQCGRAAFMVDYIFFSDEVWFRIVGYINANNYRFYCSKTPSFIVKPAFTLKNWVYGVPYRTNGSLGLFFFFYIHCYS